MTKSLLVVTLLGAIVAPPVQGQAPAQLVTFLRQSIGLDSAQLALVERGEGVVKVLDTRDRRDVAVFGIITATSRRDRKSTRLNSSHRCISYAVFCLKKKKVRCRRITATTRQR